MPWKMIQMQLNIFVLTSHKNRRKAHLHSTKTIIKFIYIFFISSNLHYIHFKRFSKFLFILMYVLFKTYVKLKNLCKVIMVNISSSLKRRICCKIRKKYIKIEFYILHWKQLKTFKWILTLDTWTNWPILKMYE